MMVWDIVNDFHRKIYSWQRLIDVSSVLCEAIYPDTGLDHYAFQLFYWYQIVSQWLWANHQVLFANIVKDEDILLRVDCITIY